MKYFRSRQVVRADSRISLDALYTHAYIVYLYPRFRPRLASRYAEFIHTVYIARTRCSVGLTFRVSSLTNYNGGEHT